MIAPNLTFCKAPNLTFCKASIAEEISECPLKKQCIMSLNEHISSAQETKKKLLAEWIKIDSTAFLFLKIQLNSVCVHKIQCKFNE